MRSSDVDLSPTLVFQLRKMNKILQVARRPVDSWTYKCEFPRRKNHWMYLEEREEESDDRGNTCIATHVENASVPSLGAEAKRKSKREKGRGRVEGIRVEGVRWWGLCDAG